ncbi:hypothetical protein FA95DRAFT_1380422 [Auriscalpium vulgare]|uniref:Uncharacterized protein n=1 Tax=Auriscalpium vulgare TaxID=40419 RepID=A0ACB8S8U7_9AGAM|nr:hypothetical protein FA95DRAFT_1380422 [Auriscalpium vulgare]
MHGTYVAQKRWRGCRPTAKLECIEYISIRAGNIRRFRSLHDRAGMDVRGRTIRPGRREGGDKPRRRGIGHRSRGREAQLLVLCPEAPRRRASEKRACRDRALKTPRTSGKSRPVYGGTNHVAVMAASLGSTDAGTRNWGKRPFAQRAHARIAQKGQQTSSRGRTHATRRTKRAPAVGDITDTLHTLRAGKGARMIPCTTGWRRDRGTDIRWGRADAPVGAGARSRCPERARRKA